VKLRAGLPVFDPWQGQEIFASFTVSKPGPPSLLSVGYLVKRQGREADHLHVFPRPRMLDLYVYYHIRFHGIVLG
jgi:hypothetical protein